MTAGAILIFAAVIAIIAWRVVRVIQADSQIIIDAATTRLALDAAAKEQHHRELLAVIHEYAAEIGGVYSILTTQDEIMREFLGHISARLHQHECEMWELNTRVGNSHGKTMRLP